MLERLKQWWTARRGQEGLLLSSYNPLPQDPLRLTAWRLDEAIIRHRQGGDAGEEQQAMCLTGNVLQRVRTMRHIQAATIGAQLHMSLWDFTSAELGILEPESFFSLVPR